jgi:asparagine synthase (glutamine-hydrolysing)
MCGICGLVKLDGAPDPIAVDRMRTSIVHRGPDDGSTDALGRCILGHQRLIVVDPEAGYQPVQNEGGDVTAVFNGELYNFPELRDSLRGHDVRGRGDTPVIPHLYEEHGTAFAERLHGMFALALWDAPRGRLVLARDRLGKKPLLYTQLADGTFAFASELKALLQLPMERELDRAAIDAYLALGYVPGDRTGLVAVRRLPPGHLLVLEDGRERVERYWEPRASDEELPDEEWLERVRETVRAAVRRRLVADVPLGALLSGGIDSTILTGLMAEASSGPVRTFTVGFSDSAYDERRWARIAAERFGTRHEEVVLDADVSATLERLVTTLDEPLGDEAILPLYLICEAAREHVTVALTGDGGDESFGGYERYAALALASRIPRAAGAAARVLPRGERRGRVERAARFLDVVGRPPAERYAAVMEVFPRELRAQLWNEDARPSAELLGAAPSPGVRGLQALDVVTYLSNDLLPKADLASMAHSLELRSPFLDHEVLELGLALPDRLKVRGLRGKVALRRAFADLLPPELAARGKTGFGLPLARWFRADLRDHARDVLLADGLFRRATVERLLADHDAGRVDHGNKLWCLLVLELWRRAWVESPAPRSPPEQFVHAAGEKQAVQGRRERS